MKFKEAINNKLFNFPVYRSLRYIVKEACLHFALSSTRTFDDAASFLGVRPGELRKEIQRFKITKYLTRPVPCTQGGRIKPGSRNELCLVAGVAFLCESRTASHPKPCGVLANPPNLGGRESSGFVPQTLCILLKVKNLFSCCENALKI